MTTRREEHEMAARALENFRRLESIEKMALCISLNPNHPELWCNTCKIRLAQAEAQASGRIQ